MAGIIYYDRERVLKFIKHRALLKELHPNFTPICKLDFTTSPELLGIKLQKIKNINL